VNPLPGAAASLEVGQGVAQRPKLAIIRRFLQDYKQLEKKTVRLNQIQPAESAYDVVTESLEAYRKSFKGPAARESNPA
jgi:hypothetical protein